MKLIDLIGYKLENLTDEEITISKNNKIYIIKIEKGEGDCCGYNELKTNLVIDENNKPIITNIIKTNKSDYNWNDRVLITFYGENKQIASIDSLSSSGSGWCYGACVSIKCNELNISERLTEW